MLSNRRFAGVRNMLDHVVRIRRHCLAEYIFNTCMQDWRQPVKSTNTMPVYSSNKESVNSRLRTTQRVSADRLLEPYSLNLDGFICVSRSSVYEWIIDAPLTSADLCIDTLEFDSRNKVVAMQIFPYEAITTYQWLSHVITNDSTDLPWVSVKKIYNLKVGLNLWRVFRVSIISINSQYESIL